MLSELDRNSSKKEYFKSAQEIFSHVSYSQSFLHIWVMAIRHLCFRHHLLSQQISLGI